MKKLLAMFLAMTMVVSLAACNSGQEETKAPETTKAEDSADDEVEPSTDEEVELRFIWWGNQVRTERTEAALDLYEEQNPNVTVDRTALQWNDYWTVNATSAAGDSLPDLMQQDYAYIEQYVATDDLVDLTPYIESGAMDCSQIADGVMATGTIGDGVYAICAGVNAPSMTYNKTLTDELGIEVPDNITFEQFEEIATKIYEETGIKTNYGYGVSENDLTYWVRAEGYPAFFEKGGLAFDGPENIQGWFEFITSGLGTWQMDPAIAAEGADAIETNALIYFTSPETQSWMACCFSNQVEAYQAVADTLDIELGITTWPSNNPSASNYLKSSQFFSVTTDTVNEAAAVDVLNFMINDVAANEILLAERGVPAPQNVADAIAPKLTKANQMVITYLNDVVTPNSSNIFPPVPDGYNEVVELLGETIEAALYGALAPGEAAQRVWDEGNAIMAAQ